MKYDQLKLPGTRKFFADLSVILIMLGFIALVIMFFNFFIEPSIGRKKSMSIFIFLFSAPSAIGGALLGKFLVYKYLKMTKNEQL